MNPFTLAERLQRDYERFTWTAYPVADPALAQRLRALVAEEALLWRGPYITIQRPPRGGGRLADLVATEGMPGPFVGVGALPAVFAAT